MPRVIDTDAADAITLDELGELLETQAFDPEDEDCFASWGPALKRLANNRSFLGDLVIEELKDRCEGQAQSNQYTPQVIMLPVRSRKFAMRANFWPAMGDSVVHNSGVSPFFYHVPHDHNFSFLTVGYLGPGYWSEYYEYDYDEVIGFTGEKVKLRYVEKARLEPGKVMLYRAHKDVHNQLPADEMSISLNIIGSSETHPFRDQYRFDLERGEIAGTINRVAIEPLLALSAHFGGEAGIDLLDTFAAGHPSDRIRFLALKARASSLGGLDERIALYERAARLPNRYFSAMAGREAEQLKRGRGWIEGNHLSS
jgi:hypothetical protein